MYNNYYWFGVNYQTKRYKSIHILIQTGATINDPHLNYEIKFLYVILTFLV